MCLGLLVLQYLSVCLTRDKFRLQSFDIGKVQIGHPVITKSVKKIRYPFLLFTIKYCALLPYFKFISK